MSTIPSWTGFRISGLLPLLVTATLSLLLSGERLELKPRTGDQIELTVEKTGFLRGKSHKFVFERYAGVVEYDAAQAAHSTVTLEIEAASILCRDTWVSAKDLKKVQEHALKDMLDAAKNPVIRFDSTAMRAMGSGQYQVDGNLTIRGVTKPVSVSVTEEKEAGGPRRFRGTAKFPMTAFGLKPPSAGLGAIGTKDEMTLTFQLAAAQ